MGVWRGGRGSDEEVEGEAGAFGEVAGDLLAEDVGEVAGREAVSGAD